MQHIIFFSVNFIFVDKCKDIKSILPNFYSTILIDFIDYTDFTGLADLFVRLFKPKGTFFRQTDGLALVKTAVYMINFTLQSMTKMKSTKKFTTVLFSILFTSSLFAQLTPEYNDIMIPMSDFEELEADVYIPAGCTSCEVVLVQTPYNKDLFQWSLPMGIGLNVDAQQFIWVIVDWRGFFGSAPAAVASPDRGQDAYDICDWIVDQPWHGSKIATWGPSALGKIQYDLIGKHHPNHTCAIPIVADPQFAYDGYFYGGVLEEARLEQLDALGYGLSPIVMANVYYSFYWQAAENASYFPDLIEIPTLQIGGWYDHNIDRMMQFYKDSRNQAAAAVQDEQWLLVGPWVHGGTGIANVGSSVQGELDYPNAEFVNNEMAWDFLEYYLLDSVNDWQATPRITYYELGTETWKYSDQDDIASPTYEILYLNSANRLTTESGNGSTELISNPNDPSPTIGGATLHPDLDQGPYDQTYLDGRDDIMTFSSDELTFPVTATGRITLTFFISATTPDCDIAVRLVDQYADGTNMLITDGIKRVRFRNGYTLTDEALMIPGEIYEVQVDLPFTNYTWLDGHRIKIYVSGNSANRWDVNLQDGLEMYSTATAQTSTITVHHDDTHQSKILLPGNNSMLGTHVEVENNSLEIYPNPANQNIEIRTTGNFTTYQLLDLSGRIISEGNLLNNSISVSTLDAGTYIVKLKDANGNYVQKKFVKG